MRKGILYALFFTLLFGLSELKAQEFQFGLDFQVGVPQNEFSDQLDDRLGVGLGGFFGYRFGNTPLMLGADLGFMNFGTDTRREQWSTTIPDATVNVENSYNLFHGDLLLRIIPPERTFRPFADGVFGFNYFFTETKIRDRGTTGPDDVIASDTNFRDTALSYGFGGGFQLRIYSDDGMGNNGENATQTPYSVHLHFMARYMIGHEAEYLREGSINIDNGTVTYDVMQSETDLLHFRVGITVSL